MRVDTTNLSTNSRPRNSRHFGFNECQKFKARNASDGFLKALFLAGKGWFGQFGLPKCMSPSAGEWQGVLPTPVESNAVNSGPSCGSWPTSTAHQNGQCRCGGKGYDRGLSERDAIPGYWGNAARLVEMALAF